jgi:hypothetical protein
MIRLNAKTAYIALIFSLLTSGICFSADITVNTATVNTNTCDQITWTDSSGLVRTGAIVRINGNPSGYQGGYFSQVTYMDGATPVICNESGAAGDLSGLGFMVNHQPTGYAGRGWANSKQDGFGGTTKIVFKGNNHIIYETEMNEYGDNGNQSKGAWKVKWQYMIRTGADYITEAIAYDFSSKPYGTYGNDIRSPYCEMNWTGTGAANTLSEAIDGIEFCATDNAGASYIFKTAGSSPFSGGYTFNTPGRNIPYTLQWKNSPDREIGYVSTFDLTQQAAGGGYLSGPVNIGSTGSSMPPNWAINYQSNGFQNWIGDKMTWEMPYGAAGGETAAESGSTTKNTFPDWTWRKNWPAYPTNGFTLLIQMGRKTADNVHKLVTEEADIHSIAAGAMTAAVGTVVTAGPMNLYDTGTIIFKPAGYNHIYRAWEINCASNAADITLALGAVSLKNQTFIFDNYNNVSAPQVTLNGSVQNEGTDMFTSVDTTAKKLYITFNKTITASSRIILAAAGSYTASPTITPFYSPTITPTVDGNISCVDFTIDRSAVPSMVFMKKLTLKVNVGTCSSVSVLVDGVLVPSIYNAGTKEVMFTAKGTGVEIQRSGYGSDATNAVTKCTLYNNKKWAYSFTFDDGRPDTRTVVLPLFSSYGYIGGSALNTGSMTEASDGYVMSWQSADVLRAAGWSMYDHNATHQAVTCSNIASETAPDRSAINARWPGYTCTHFVYPYCDTTYYTCIRDSGYFLSAENNTGDNYADVVPANLFILNRNSMMSAGNAGTAALANALADAAAADTRSRWMIMFAHDVAPGSTGPATTYDTNEAVLSAHIAYIYNTYGSGGSDNMWFAPTDEVMQYILTRANAVVTYLGPGTCGSIPTPPSATPTQTPGGPTPTFTATLPASDCLLDDMEDNNNANNFGGYWFTTASGNGATVVPASGGTFTMTSGGYSSSYCAHMSGTVGTQAPDYPSIAMVTQLNAKASAPAYGGTGQVTDISGCGGIQFWAKGDGKQYYLKIPYTDVNEVSLTGYGDYKAPFTAPAAWTLITIPFSALTQETWDTQVSKTTVLQNSKVFQFVTGFYAASGTTTADLSVDNVKVTSCSVCPGASVPTATKTNTIGTTSTYTPTLTPTLSNSATPSTTKTTTPTFTATMTLTSTPTFTQTDYAGTPTDTWTVSSTPTITQTLSITETWTASETFTNTPADTMTSTFTSTPTITLTGTETDTATITTSPTNIPADTATMTYTATLTLPPTKTITPSVTNTATATSSTTESPAFTATATLTITRTTVEASDKAKISGEFVFPNPVNGAAGLNLSFKLSAKADKIVLRLYSTSMRLIREKSISGLTSGHNVAAVNNSFLKDLSSGAYYYVLEVFTGASITDRSRIGKVIILRQYSK